jgi:exosortase/archaeosortase family protein
LTEETISVVEACSGLSMLMVFLALAFAVACTVERPLWQRLVIGFSAVPVALFANIVRISVTGILHVTVSSEAADAFFHDLGGWLMMPLALAILLVEVRFCDRLFIADQRPPAPAASYGNGALALGGDLVSTGSSRAATVEQLS